MSHTRAVSHDDESYICVMLRTVSHDDESYMCHGMLRAVMSHGYIMSHESWSWVIRHIHHVRTYRPSQLRCDLSPPLEQVVR